MDRTGTDEDPVRQALGKPRTGRIPHAQSGRIGLTVVKIQTMHKGHTLLFKHMIEDCDVSILAIGSTQRSREVGHPFTYEQRVNMVKAVFGPLIRPIPLVDIDSLDDNDDWVDYVLEKIKKASLPEPTDLYSGSRDDARWYFNRFAGPDDLVRTTGPVTTFDATGRGGRRLHILDRVNLPISATGLRTAIERRDDDWKDKVPAKLVNYIEQNYPPHLRTALKVDSFPEDVPIGTAAILSSDGVRYQLKDDGVWRPERRAGDYPRMSEIRRS
jgi:nicotinic acid mononucleotide adenylyltransferase